ncbi:MAG: phospholipase D-like domain-containing protein [Kangiellaceae bacterium]|nr:phospholipase D-like domain-containing protein [Kangiellaceae bacterium]MCW9000771.1 phospholipase D-like domain-containing protein [Kangiellaceae bacterium]
MALSEFSDLLSRSFEDFHLSNDEKKLITLLCEELKSKTANLNYARNKAFELVRDATEKNPQMMLKNLKWLQGVVKAIDSVRHSPEVESIKVAFSPGKDCEDSIIRQLEKAACTVDICVFTISNDLITKSIEKAHKRNVRVRIISDNDKMHDRGSDIQYLCKLGIPIRVDKTDNHMHHKFALFDNTTLINGSYNWTRSATKYNQEDIVIQKIPQVVEKFKQRFERLWQETKALSYA